MQSYLIIGGTKAERQKKAEEIVQNYKIAPFDQITLGEENRQSIGISQVRHLQHQLSLKPYSSSYKIAVLPEAEKLTIPAQNAMLKLLEEPPRNTFIILCSQNPDLLLTTVVSRCQVIRLRDKPQRNIPKKILNSQFLILDSIVKSGVGERLKMADEIAKNREEAIRFCQAQLMIWREKIFKAQSAKTIHLILKTLNMLEANVNSKLALENLLLHYPFGRSGIVPGRTNR